MAFHFEVLLFMEVMLLLIILSKIIFADASSLEIIQTEDTVIEGKNISLLCNASGKPEPTITWTRVDSLGVLSKTPSLTIVNVSRPGTPDNMIRYQCTARNGVGRPALAFSNITVHCKSVFRSFHFSLQRVVGMFMDKSLNYKV